jgi:hypothetical protein
MTGWGCDNLRSAVKLCRTNHGAQAQPARNQFSHGVKRTESLHVENVLDRSVTRVVAAGLYSKGGARGPGYRRR